MDELRRQNYQVAILELNDIVDEYGGEVAGKALFNLANAYYASRNYNEAIASFQEYIDNYQGNKLVVSSAIAGVAACYEGIQEFQMAADKYIEAARYYPESPSVPDYLLGAVRNYINVGNITRADEILDELSTDYSRSDQYRTAIRLVAQSKS
jgi:TolA-binding protein